MYSVYINSAGMPRSRISCGDNKEFLLIFKIIYFVTYFSDDKYDAISIV